MKRAVTIALTLLLALSLAACNPLAKQEAKSPTPETSPTAQAGGGEQKMVHGTINRIDEYLVLMTDDEEYQVMDLGEGVTLDGFSEGDKVNVLYTGTLGSESNPPVILELVKTDA